MASKRKNCTWSQAEKSILKRLSNPERIQSYLDSLKYNITDLTRSAREVIRTGQAHCFDGAMFAAAALEFNGFTPLLIDLRANQEDDDHILAVFRRHGLWGAIGKSNYVSCRFRDPVHRNIRELALSYFNHYFNLAGTKTLREYSTTFDLRQVRDFDWRFGTEDISDLGNRLDSIRHFRLFPPKVDRELTLADDRLFEAETLGVDPRGAFKIDASRLIALRKKRSRR